MTLCLPANLPARIEPLAAVDFAALAASPRRVLVLVRDVAALVAAARRGLTPAQVSTLNLGNIHFGSGRRPVSPSIFLNGEELGQLEQLAALGFGIEARAIPSEPPAGLGELERRYAAAP
jgi:PTS system mannose-specific IIB component